MIVFDKIKAMPSSSFIENQKKVYKTLQSCFCPAIQETVHFTSEGLNHLLYHRRRPRNHDERHYRAGLIPYLTVVINNSTRAVKEIKSENPLVVVWLLSHEININNKRQIVKVILSQKGAGKVKFLSAMRKKYTFRAKAN
ncbi:MAG: hypothetical protein NTZ84_03790 [Candidatus Nealsonbacteria bacterium]|nr:hypothetical protein [Candidatus Nealsonbacteria bacterium]